MASMQGMMQGCMAMGMACAEECRSHADMHDHCRICASACDQMVEACRSMMSGMGMSDAGSMPMQGSDMGSMSGSDMSGSDMGGSKMSGSNMGDMRGDM
jgi:hypothetical protein